MDTQSWITYFLSPAPEAIILTLILALSIPFLAHYILYRSVAVTTLPSFLLLGPSNSGKTSLLTLVNSYLIFMVTTLLTSPVRTRSTLSHSHIPATSYRRDVTACIIHRILKVSVHQ